MKDFLCLHQTTKECTEYEYETLHITWHEQSASHSRTHWIGMCVVLEVVWISVHYKELR